MKYNQVRFYHTTTPVFSAGTPLGTEDIQPDNLSTMYYDDTNTTGFGWFVYLNHTTAHASQNSNAIPYAGFAENSVKKILDKFFSLLNNKEAKLISIDDAFSWLNEAYSIAVNELNLVNIEYKADDGYDLVTEEGLAEYSLPDDFSQMLSVYDSDNDVEVEHIDLSDISDWNSNSGNTRKYYLRGGYLGFSPVPTGAVNYQIQYLTKAGTLTSYYQNVEMPDDNYHFLKDYMIFRAYQKLNRSNAKDSLKLFNDGISRMKITSIKQNANQDSFDISDKANI